MVAEREVLAAFAVINAVALLAVVADKWRAKARQRRTPEQVLLAWTFLGPVGAWTGFLAVRHKTGKARFSLRAAVAAGLGVVAWILLGRL